MTPSKPTTPPTDSISKKPHICNCKNSDKSKTAHTCNCGGNCHDSN